MAGCDPHLGQHQAEHFAAQTSAPHFGAEMFEGPLAWDAWRWQQQWRCLNRVAEDLAVTAASLGQHLPGHPALAILKAMGPQVVPVVAAVMPWSHLACSTVVCWCAGGHGHRSVPPGRVHKLGYRGCPAGPADKQSQG